MTSTLSPMRRRFFFTAAVCLVTGCGTWLAVATPPPWWSSRGVLQAGTTANDYAAANNGQLKNIAAKAADELNTKLPGGAGVDINGLITAWRQPAGTGVVRDDFAAVNLGQVKNVAQPFYDRLIETGYYFNYPWIAGQGQQEDFQVANIGQIKNVFNLNLEGGDAALTLARENWNYDGDHDGLPDIWEIQMFGDLSQGGDGDFDGDGISNYLEWKAGGTRAKDFFNGQKPSIAVLSGAGQHLLPNRFGATPTVIRLTHATTGLPLVHAPVTFNGGEHTPFALVRNGTAMATLLVYTDSQGCAQAYYRVSVHEGANVAMIKAGSSSVEVSAECDYTLPPAAPTHFKAAYTANNTTTLSWTDNSSDESFFLVERSIDREEWQTITQLPANSTSYVGNDGSNGPHYYYRVISCYAGVL